MMFLPTPSPEEVARIERLGLRSGGQMHEDYERNEDGTEVIVRRWVANLHDGMERQLWPCPDAKPIWPVTV